MYNDAVSVHLEGDGLTLGVYRKGKPAPLRFFLGHKPQVQFAVASAIAEEIWKEGKGKYWVSDNKRLTIQLYEEGQCTYEVNYQHTGIPTRSYYRHTAALTLGMANCLCTLLAVYKWNPNGTVVNKPSLRDKVVLLQKDITRYLDSCEEAWGAGTATPRYQTLLWVSRALGDILEGTGPRPIQDITEGA